MTTLAAHEGHQVHPHAHTPQPDGSKDVCSGRWFCLSCKPPQQRGTWFGGPFCPGTKPWRRAKT